MSHWTEQLHHSGETIAIGDIPVPGTDEVILSGYVFEDCTIRGPAVLVFLGEQTEWDAPDFAAPNPDALFWDLPGDMVKPAGAVALNGCVFRRCRFERITLAASAESNRSLRAALIPRRDLPH